MRDKVNNGGPAFPNQSRPHGYAQDGMSLRDYFAAKAMQAAWTNNIMREDARLDVGKGEGSTVAEVIAGHAYRVADAMIKARSSSLPAEQEPR